MPAAVACYAMPLSSPLYPSALSAARAAVSQSRGKASAAAGSAAAAGAAAGSSSSSSTSTSSSLSDCPWLAENSSSALQGLSCSASCPVPFPSAEAHSLLAASAGAVRLCLSADDAYLFLAARDGSLVAFELRDSEGRLPASDSSGKLPWAQEVLLTLSDMEERRSAISALRDTLVEVQGKAESSSRLRLAEHEDTLKGLAGEFENELNSLQQMRDLVDEERADMEKGASDAMTAAESSHRMEVSHREAFYQSKLMHEVDRYSKHAAERDASQAAWARKRSSALAAHEARLASLKESSAAALVRALEEQALLSREVEAAGRAAAEGRQAAAGEADEEVDALRAAYAARIDSEREASLRYKSENAIMRKKTATSTEQLQEGKLELLRRAARSSELAGIISACEKEVALLKGVVHDKDSSMRAKELKISE